MKLIDVDAGRDALVDVEIETGRDVVVGGDREESPPVAAEPAPDPEPTPEPKGTDVLGMLTTMLPWAAKLVSFIKLIYKRRIG